MKERSRALSLTLKTKQLFSTNVADGISSLMFLFILFCLFYFICFIFDEREISTNTAEQRILI